MLSDFFERGTAAALACQTLMILSYYTLSQRYSVDLYPFLIICFMIFLRRWPSLLPRIYPVPIVLVALSVTINSLATISWLAEADQNVRPETHAFYNQLQGRSK